MPTYEYTCTACGHDWEAFQSIKAEPLTECPKCGAPEAKRQVSLGGGFILKGGGWYSDLYSSQSNKTGSSGPSSTSSSSTTSKPTSKTSSGDGAGKTSSSSEPATTAA